jgi:acetyl-CoA carboxylase biotin carboxylase subunit
VPSGPGVRWDSGIEAGSHIGLYYDPMLAKLIVHAPTRELAIARMRRALHELVIDGIETSRTFHLRVMDHPAFQSGDISIQWLEQTLPELTAPNRDRETLKLAALAGALLAHDERTSGRRTGVGATSPTGGVATNHAVPHANASWAAVARRESLRESIR